MEDLTVLSPIGELSTSSWRLAPPSWISWLPPHCLLVDNYFLVLENFTFWPVSDVTIGLLAFFFSGGLVRTFSSSSAATFSSFSRLLPLDQYLLVVPKLQSDFVSNVTIGHRDSQKIVVTFCLLRIRAMPCYYLHGSTSLLSFANVTVGLPRWSSSWGTRFINRVLRPIFPLLPLHRVSQHSTAAQSRQDFYRIMLGVSYNRSIVSC